MIFEYHFQEKFTFSEVLCGVIVLWQKRGILSFWDELSLSFFPLGFKSIFTQVKFIVLSHSLN